MAVVVKIAHESWGDGMYTFQCPACGCCHYFATKENPHCSGETWTWNGDAEKPTVSPSINVEPIGKRGRCHFHVKDGRIHFCGDCGHDMKGQIVDMIDWDDDDSTPDS